VALLRNMTYNLRHPVGLRHLVGVDSQGHCTLPTPIKRVPLGIPKKKMLADAFEKIIR